METGRYLALVANVREDPDSSVTEAQLADGIVEAVRLIRDQQGVIANLRIALTDALKAKK